MYVARLTDAELAARAGVSRAHINRIRNGRATPRLDTAVALAHGLGCRVRDLFYLH
jgi:DNA-binding XRE family transcriptional regulator